MVQPCGQAPVGEGDFWSLYEQALPRVYGYLARRSDRSIAEDLTQEVFSTAARTVAAGHGAKVTLPWLLTVARSRLFDHLRAQHRRHRNLGLVGERRGSFDASAMSVEDAYEARHLAPRTESALASLSPDQRAALLLHHGDDLSVAEVADALGRSVRATESLLARSRRAFRAAFEEVVDA